MTYGAKAVTFYEVLVSDRLTQWSVGRRYKDFERLHAALRGDMELPPMPSRSAIMAHLSEAFVEERQDALFEFLRRVVECDPLARRPEVRQFLDVRTAAPRRDEPQEPARRESQPTERYCHLGSVELSDMHPKDFLPADGSGDTQRDLSPAEESSDESILASIDHAENPDQVGADALEGAEPDSGWITEASGWHRGRRRLVRKARSQSESQAGAEPDSAHQRSADAQS